MTTTGSWRDWPALAEIGKLRRWRLQCAQGVWGKEPGCQTDAHWVAAGAGFTEASRARALAVYLGAEDDLTALLLWHGGGGVHQAAYCRASRFADAAGRGFLERHYLEWRNEGGWPAVLGAFVLLARAVQIDEGLWPSGAPAPGGAVEAPLELPPLQLGLDEAGLAQAITDGCRDLGERVEREALGAMYAHLLAGNRLVRLPPAAQPLTPGAFAALLLPLARDLADGCAMLSRLPSRRLDPRRFAAGAERPVVRWHLLGPGDCDPQLLPAPDLTPDAAQHRLGVAMAEALLGNDPGTLARSSALPAAAVQPVSAAPAGSRELRIWGAASAGKTAYLAQLFTKIDHGGAHGWSVRLPPDANAAWFKARLDGVQKQNRFPEATPIDAQDPLAYRLVHEATGRSATIRMEDRPGRDSEVFDDAMARRLAAADAILLLLDPRRDPARQNEEVRRAFLTMQQARRDPGRDPRPLAVCLSKCDEYIRSVADYQEAMERPESFLRRRLGRIIPDAVAHGFSNPRYFALSAAGLHLVHGAVWPGVFFDETFEPRIGTQARPINLLEPLIWLVEALGP